MWYASVCLIGQTLFASQVSYSSTFLHISDRTNQLIFTLLGQSRIASKQNHWLCDELGLGPSSFALVLLLFEVHSNTRTLAFVDNLMDLKKCQKCIFDRPRSHTNLQTLASIAQASLIYIIIKQFINPVRTEHRLVILCECIFKLHTLIDTWKYS